MKRIIRGFHHLMNAPAACVAAIGNFDGVHLGHQAVLDKLIVKSNDLKLPAIVIVFEPQPNEFFLLNKAPARLSLFREKLEVISSYSIDELCVLPFNEKLANMTAKTFIQRLLVDGLNIKYLVVGDDFKFGKGRQGNLGMLQQAGHIYGFGVANIHTFSVNQMRVSSTQIRHALQSGDLMLAKKLLGRPYWMSGRVAHGDKRGRKIGFPTANIHLHRHNAPLSGVYAVQLFGVQDEPIQGVANVGTRPTVNDSQALLEVHLFDFDSDIYGKRVRVHFLHKLRDEQKFTNFTALTEQIKKDAQQARLYFANN